MPWYFYSLLLIIIFAVPVSAQEQTDSIQPKKDTSFLPAIQEVIPDVQFFKVNDAFEYFPLDTGVLGLHYYYPHQHFRGRFSNMILGNIGLPHYARIFHVPNDISFDAGVHDLDAYILHPDSLTFYESAKPHSDLFFILGTQNELLFSVKHSQPITRFLRMGFYYRRTNNLGIYQRQTAIHNNVGITARIQTGKKYMMLLSSALNNVKSQENGGTALDNVFADTSFIQKEIIPVKLESASHDWRDHSVTMSQYIKLSGGRILKDSTKHITDHQGWYINHQVRYRHRWYRFTDPTPNINYYGIYFESSDTLFRDVEDRTVSTSVSMLYNPERKKKATFQLPGIDAGVRFAYIKWQHGERQQSMFNLTPYLSISSDPVKGVSYGFDARLNLIDAYAGTFSGDLRLGYNSDKFGAISISASTSRRMPSLMDLYFPSDSAGWSENFDPELYQSVDVSYSWADQQMMLSYRFVQMKDIILYDSLAQPFQVDRWINLHQFSASKGFEKKGFLWRIGADLQITPDDELLRLPLLILNTTIYYERGLFKNNLIAGVGLDMRYQTNFSPQRYFPLTGQFFLTDEPNLSYYPVVDFFINLRVKTVRIFLMLDHVNQGLGRKGYYATYDYPGKDRTFRVGISWRFFD